MWWWMKTKANTRAWVDTPEVVQRYGLGEVVSEKHLKENHFLYLPWKKKRKRQQQRGKKNQLFPLQASTSFHNNDIMNTNADFLLFLFFLSSNIFPFWFMCQSHVLIYESGWLWLVCGLDDDNFSQVFSSHVPKIYSNSILMTDCATLSTPRLRQPSAGESQQRVNSDDIIIDVEQSSYRFVSS